MVLGVCGKVCSGKDAVSDILLQQGWYIIDADKLSREVLLEQEEKIILAFSKDDIINQHGCIDREKLGKVVFNNKKKLYLLNTLSHPYIIEKIYQKIQSSVEENIVVNAALLPITKISGIDALLFVQASLKERISRARARDKKNWFFIFQRIWIQRQLKPQLFWKNVDIYYVNNNKTLLDLKNEVNLILDKIKGKR